jgi:uncharacterized membrane protein YqjE
MDESPRAEGGLWSSLTRLLKTLGDIAENRVELFVVEWQEARLRLLDAMVLLIAGTVCALVALLVATFAVLAAFWETHRALVLTLVILAYAGAAVVLFGMLHSRLRRWRAFAATLEQIKKDRACFKEKN